MTGKQLCGNIQEALLPWVHVLHAVFHLLIVHVTAWYEFLIRVFHYVVCTSYHQVGASTITLIKSNFLPRSLPTCRCTTPTSNNGAFSLLSFIFNFGSRIMKFLLLQIVKNMFRRGKAHADLDVVRLHPWSMTWSWGKFTGRMNVHLLPRRRYY